MKNMSKAAAIPLLALWVFICILGCKVPVGPVDEGLIGTWFWGDTADGEEVTFRQDKTFTWMIFESNGGDEYIETEFVGFWYRADYQVIIVAFTHRNGVGLKDWQHRTFGYEIQKDDGKLNFVGHAWGRR